jgi:hypothetical protein
MDTFLKEAKRYWTSLGKFGKTVVVIVAISVVPDLLHSTTLVVLAVLAVALVVVLRKARAS